ncbi:MAG: MFS transporter [Rhizobacter sp.]|nr:MFS transporter [Burkholderiales bacterium]
MINLDPYRTLFADHELRRIILSSVLPRLPIGMNALGLTLLVQSQTQSFTRAGMVSAAYLCALAIQAPIIGRFVDNNGPKAVMMPLAILHALALLLLVFAVTQVASLPLMLAAAFLAGAVFPPVSMTIRAMYRKSDMPDAQKRSAFAVESVILECSFILGPLIVSLTMLAGSPAFAVLASAVMGALGTWHFSRSGALTRWGVVERGENVVRHWLGPLKVPAVRRALLLSFFFAVGIGLNEIAIPAFANHSGFPARVGWFYAAMSIPSAIMGIAYGSRHFAWPLNRQIMAAGLWLAAGSTLMAVSMQTWTFMLACAFTGLAFGPMITALSLQLGKLSPIEYSTEAFTWSMTLFMVGLGIGFWVGGGLIEQFGGATSLFACTGLMLVAAVCCLAVPEVRNEPDVDVAATA